MIDINITRHKHYEMIWDEWLYLYWDLLAMPDFWEGFDAQEGLGLADMGFQRVSTDAKGENQRRTGCV